MAVRKHSLMTFWKCQMLSSKGQIFGVDSFVQFTFQFTNSRSAMIFDRRAARRARWAPCRVVPGRSDQISFLITRR